MTTERLVAGANCLIGGVSSETFQAVFGTEINSLASGNAVLSSILIDNSASPADVYGVLSGSFGSLASSGGSPYVGFYLYPLVLDTGTTYGDGNYTGAGATPPVAGPPANYFCGSIPLVPGVTAAFTGTSEPFPLYFGKQKLVLYNATGTNPMPSSGNIVSMKTMNRNLS